MHEKSLAKLLTLQSTLALTSCLAKRRCSRTMCDTVCVDSDETVDFPGHCLVSKSLRTQQCTMKHNAYGWQYAVDAGWIRHVPAQPLLVLSKKCRLVKLSSPTHTCKPRFYLVVFSVQDFKTVKVVFCDNLPSAAPSDRWTESAARLYILSRPTTRRLCCHLSYLSLTLTLSMTSKAGPSYLSELSRLPSKAVCSLMVSTQRRNWSCSETFMLILLWKGEGCELCRGHCE